MTPEQIISNLQEIISNLSNPTDLPTKHINLPINDQLTLIEGKENTVHTTLIEHAKGTHPIMHASLDQLMTDFLEYKCKRGSEIERKFYKNISVEEMITRLLTKRPLMFMTKNDLAVLRDGSRIKDGKEIFDAIGSDNQSSKLSLENYLSYDEMQLSALLGVSSPSTFINDGDRNNCGVVATSKTYEATGIITGLVGARFEREERMEWQHMLITPKQNISEKGYGSDAKPENAARLQAFANLYARMGAGEGLSVAEDYCRFPSYLEVMKEKKDNKAAFDQKYIHIPGKGILNKQVYKARMRLVIEPFLIDANNRAMASEQEAYVHAVGLGIGVWALNKGVQAQLMLEVYQEIICNNVLTNISDIDFSWFPTNTKYIFSNEETVVEGNNKVKIHFSKRNPQAKLIGQDAKKLCVSMYAWDSNSFPGNEYWDEQLNASGDPAAACNSQIVLLHSPVNPLLLGENTKILGEVQSLVAPTLKIEPPTSSIPVKESGLEVESSDDSITFCFSDESQFIVAAEEKDDSKLEKLIEIVEKIDTIQDLQTMIEALNNEANQTIFSSLHDRGMFSLRRHEWRAENCRQTWARLMQFIQIKSAAIACQNGKELPEFATVATKYYKRTMVTAAQSLFKTAQLSSSKSQAFEDKLDELKSKLLTRK